MRKERPSTLVIADDDAGFAEFVQAILAEQGYDVVARAPNGEEAVRLAAELQPDLVLMDLNMPVMDGIEATRAIADSLSAVRVLLVTGSAWPGDVARARSAGASGYVPKDRIGDLADAILAVALPAHERDSLVRAI